MQKIYIVEDDKNIAEIEEFALKNSGFEVYNRSMEKLNIVWIKKWKINIRI